MARPSPTATFFTTFELLEQTLSLLPMLTVVRAQNVSTFFRDVINTSPPLQRLLFLRPALATPDSKHHIHSQLNPILEGHFFRPEPDPRSEPNISAAYFPWSQNPRRRDAFLRPEASWRRMLVTESPATRLAVSQIVSIDSLELHRNGFIPFTPSRDSEMGVMGSPCMSLFYDIMVAALHVHLQGRDYFADHLSVSCYDEVIKCNDHEGSSDIEEWTCHAGLAVRLSRSPFAGIYTIDRLGGVAPSGKELVERAFRDSKIGDWTRIVTAIMTPGSPYSYDPMAELEAELALSLPLPDEDDSTELRISWTMGL